MEDVMEETTQQKMQQAPLTQLKAVSINTDALVNNMLDVTAALPIPMASTVVFSVRKVLDIFSFKSSASDTKDKLDEIAKGIENMFEVVKDAVKTSLLDEHRIKIQSNYGLIRGIIDRNNTSEMDDLSDHIDDIYHEFSKVIETAKDLCSNYQTRMSSQKILLTDYVRNYLIFDELVLNSSALAIESCAITAAFISSKKAPRKERERWAAIVSKCEQHASHFQERTDKFSKEDFVRHFPVWLTPGKSVYIQNMGDSKRFFSATKKNGSYTGKIEVDKKDYLPKEGSLIKQFMISAVTENSDKADSKWFWKILLANNNDYEVSYAEYKGQSPTPTPTGVVYGEGVYLLNKNSPASTIFDAIQPTVMSVTSQYTVHKTIDDYLVFEFSLAGKAKSLDRNKDKLKKIDFNLDKKDQNWKILD